MRGNKSKNRKQIILFPHGVTWTVSALGRKSGRKSNEITAILQLLEIIQVKGNVLTIDAIGTQTEIAEKIKQKRARLHASGKGNPKICIGK